MASRLRGLDERVFPSASSETRLAHGRRFGWLYLLALGAVVLGVCLWAIAANHPVIFFMNIGLAVVYLFAAAYLFVQRKA